ncbi:GntP family permease [Streptomyces sp. CMB-StM0423]|uniref:GntP family permease n=1 Tax=Streptomyces sp. CMB-StM0423 TaxID=2059884 RepID=UPI000C70F38C|nr:SLC13 family permease [Streptomyces sp. CMB-StM0423]AUH44390.1 gluconate transporter [Streptomyces sp. CMB-StM0423]
MTALHTAIAILVVILLILVPKVEPVIALVIGSLYLGIASGLGFEGTIHAIVGGFGDIMAEVGLLIGFGVLLGSLLNSMGSLQKLVEKLLRALGPGKLPYALAGALSAVFPSIYVDVQLVLAAPLAKSAAPRMGRYGLPMMSGALSAGILVGYVFVVPGLGTLAIAGLLHVPLSTMLVYGFVLGPLAALLTTFLYGRLLRHGLWNADTDEVPDAENAQGDQDERDDRDAPATGAGGAKSVPPRGSRGNAAPGSGRRPAGGSGAATTAEAPAAATSVAADAPEADVPGARRPMPPLYLALLPIAFPLLLIATGAISDAAGVKSDLLTFLGDPAFALFAGLVGAYALAKWVLTDERVGEAMTEGFHSTGQILLVTGVGGSLGAVIGETGLDDVLADIFSADAGMSTVVTILLVWLVAALLHLAIGSIGVAAIAAAGIIAPIMGELAVPPAVLALAIGSGSLFALQVNSNFFWMFQPLLGVTTRGALKALTFVTALASVVSLALVIAVSFVV